MAKDWIFVAGLCLARIAFGYQFQSLATMAPELVARFHIDYRLLGTLVGLYMLPGVVVALPGGLLGRRFGARLIVGLGLVLMSLGALLPLLVFDPRSIGLGRALSGIGAVALVVMQGQMVSDRFPGRRFMPVMGLLVGAFPVGAGLVGLTHDPLLAAAGPAGLFMMGAALAAASLLLFLPTVQAAPAGRTASWAMPSRHECKLVVVAGLAWTAYNAGYYGFLSYMPSMLATQGHTPGLIATVMVIATWANLPATVLGGALAVRIGNWPVFLVGTVAEVVAVAGQSFADWPLVWATLFGTAAAAHAGVIIAIGTLSARPENRATGMGLFYTTYYLGGAVLPAVCGGAADWLGSPAGALLAAAALSALAVPTYLLHQSMQRRPA
ncbi:MAG: MFS transporter [Janthinobacterium lividum]